MKKIFFLLGLVFVFSSCQKCWQCTTEKRGEIDIEIEICEDDNTFSDIDYYDIYYYMYNYYYNGGLTFDEYMAVYIYQYELSSPKEFVNWLEDQNDDFRCHSTLW